MYAHVYACVHMYVHILNNVFFYLSAVKNLITTSREREREREASDIFTTQYLDFVDVINLNNTENYY